jgi:hypothetical protein
VNHDQINQKQAEGLMALAQQAPHCDLAQDGVCETLDCPNHPTTQTMGALFAQGLTTNNAAVDRENQAYESGWNSALEMAAFKIEHDFKQAFGADTLSSLAVFIRGMKK